MFVVALKSVFNANGCMLDGKQSNLYTNMVEMIMCMKDWVATKFKLQNWVVDNIFEYFNNKDVEDEYKLYR